MAGPSGTSQGVSGTAQGTQSGGGVGDLLTSIMSKQDVLYAPAKHVQINKDGTLTAKDSWKEHQIKREKRKQRLSTDSR